MADPAGVWLAIDTATDRAGVALHDGASVMAETQWTSRRRQTAELGQAIQAMLDSKGVVASDLAGIAVAGGPGSYTGLRVGMALAKGLALGCGLPLVAVPTMDILAAPWSAPWSARSVPLWVVLAAGRGRLVAAVYPPDGADRAPGRSDTSPEEYETSRDRPATPPARVYTLDQLLTAACPPAWVVGELDAPARAALAEAGLTVLPPAAGLRRAGWLAELGRARAVTAERDLADVVPTYVDPAG